MEESSTNTAAATTTNSITTPSTSNTNQRTSSSGSSSGANNMETKSINIPTNVQHAENTSSGSSIISSSISKSTEATTSQSQSGLSNTNTTTRTTQEAVENVSGINKSSVGSLPNENVNSSEKAIVHRGENGECDSKFLTKNTAESEKSGKSSGDSDNQSQPNITNAKPIDLAKGSTNPLLLSDHQAAPDSSSTSTTTITSSTAPEKVLCAESDSTSSLSKSTRTHSASEDCVQEVDPKGAFNCSSSSSTSAKPPVPNFRVEGSGAGDSSITVAVASLSSAVSASVTLHSSGGGRAGSTGGSNSLENGEQPGSSSGPVSIQSSEEMRLSLVSWYSEPGDDPSRLIEGCCSALNTYRHEGEIAEEVVGDRDICGSSNSMGQEAVSSVTNSPACKSESEEKENKTPEPCGNIDKMKSAEEEDDTNGTLSKKEFIYLSSNDNAKKADSDSNNTNITSICNQEDSKCQALVNKVGDSESVSGSVAKTNASNLVKPGADASKSIKQPNPSSHKSKAHVHMSDHKQSSGSSLSHSTPSTGGGHTSRCLQEGSGRSAKPECPRCSRRSKSGTTTPASGSQVSRTRTPASRRVVQSSKSSTEIKKPIKSILKHDSRGSAGSGSGSDKQSSMDSLGSSGDIGVTPIHLLRGRIPNALMTRSDSGTRARFNFTAGTPETPTGVPEDKVVSKLKRIEKYATLRVRKSMKPRPLDLSDSEAQSNDVHNGVHSSGGRTGVPGVPNELMSKSMSYLEKSSSNRVHISSTQGHPYGESHSQSSTLKRQGSLRLKKPSTPQWEPTGTKTSKLRLQKMQAATGKSSSGGGGASSGSANSGSAHSGSGDSLHYLPHSANTTSASGSSYGSRSVHLIGAHSAPTTSHSRMTSTVAAAAKEKHMGAKIFSKLSSALGQTASSNQKRIRQERGVQTEGLATAATHDLTNIVRVSLSPIPAVESGAETSEQIKNLERLCNRYRNQAMKIQSDFEQSEYKKVELMKQLEENQVESNEMIDFLQAEKSTLAESLTEVEVEAKKWKDEIEALKKDYQSRCSSLVRLSEQHKQEALKSQALLHRLESQSTSAISQLSHQIADGAQGIYTTRQRVHTLTESLLKTYRVPPELLASLETNQAIKETDLSCSLLLPLITSLSAAFPMVPMDSKVTKSYATTGNSTTPSSSNATLGHSISPPSTSDSGVASITVKVDELTHKMFANQCTSLTLTESTSLQSLNQAILEREAAEKSGLDDIMKPFSLFEGVSPDADQLSLRKEITELNAAIAKLLHVVKIILINSDKKVSSVASSILQCLKSIEDDKVGNMAEIAQVQKSLEAWSEKGMSEKESSSNSTSSSNGSPPCKTTVASTSVGGSPPTYLVGNGHAHV
ncbi:unnamed protein product [Orchesella dallaii]|uniref:Uncharacterized protein n=1 Tax=Orchesella dallaii TaxID=48710 RepID=A0ABP1PXL7_9HEXA